jgi:hypothetical protein
MTKFCFHVCEVHEDIIGIQEANPDYQSKCGGHQPCGWESDAGYLVLDADNVVTEFHLAFWVDTYISRGVYSFSHESVLYNLHDIDNNVVEVKGIHPSIRNERTWHL